LARLRYKDLIPDWEDFAEYLAKHPKLANAMHNIDQKHSDARFERFQTNQAAAKAAKDAKDAARKKQRKNKGKKVAKPVQAAVTIGRAYM